MMTQTVTRYLVTKYWHQKQLKKGCQMSAFYVLFVNVSFLVVLFLFALFITLPIGAFADTGKVLANKNLQHGGHHSNHQCHADIHTAYAHVIAQERLQYDERHRPMVNINRADEATLTTLEGIGSSKAQAIILYREMFGGFANVDELAKVKGIGQKTVDNNRDRLSVID